MTKLIGIALLAAVAGSAGSISYDAFVGCNNTCVTVSLAWADMPTPVVNAGVLDSTGRMLFALDVPTPPLTTGSLLPNPQTVFGLTADTVQIITNGQPVSAALRALASETASEIEAETSLYANVCILDAYGNPIHTARFIATATPEPATVFLAVPGLGMLCFAARRRHLLRR